MRRVRVKRKESVNKRCILGWDEDEISLTQRRWKDDGLMVSEIWIGKCSRG